MTVDIARQGDLAIVTIDNPPVNATSQAVRQVLSDAVRQTSSDPDVRAVVLRCAGRTFVAGGDVTEFDKPPVPPHLPDVIAAIEDADKPWIAALHGSVLGGGLELAMGCHARIGAPATKLGLPEVSLGLIPGAGGTVRLPRLVEADLALDMVATGKPISAERALKAGLIDRIAEGDLLDAAKELARRTTAPRRTLSRPARPPKDPNAFAAEAATLRARARGQNSPVAAVAAIERALELPADAALAAERQDFLELKADPQSKALRRMFFAERQTLKDDPRAAGTARPLAHIGVVGGGTMGAGIAAAALLSGLSVTMVERDADALAAGQGRVGDILDGSLKRGKISPKRHAEIQAVFAGSVDYAALSDADLVIEAVFEDIQVKTTVFKALDSATRPDAVLATNTSYLDVGQIASAVSDPSRVIGLHFFSPAHIMKLLELVVPDRASPDAVATGAALGKRLGKITVLSGVCDGFIGNRIMSAYRREADYMIEDGALPADVDKAMRDFGFPIGVFEMQDLAGLDIAWAMRKRRAATRDPNERYIEIADRLCEQGRLGRKTGKGWYRYSGKTAEVDPEVTALIEAESARKGIVRKPLSDDAIMARILTVMQTEGRAILSEGIAAKSSDIDVVMVNGYGFPRWRGGPMFMAGEM
ncbi:3-hydroxyacyl-CoA dehydrogenase NAD-binding domain-containing protein [Marivita hallyeonensis]|uniref:Short chain enoyl-CoA hydratase /3-hydroxyacyl-CoA dehydrogenase n=1 Tax=Marivita hallyeonensis TaxID=996342 RepID=A0A1M5NVQ6_9RHOB|nr:3-hydroxyacyl-CoA dehydrogenase NAD-binding domain-containing protein [Marivita hallyeonensis]SHG93577.1 short chain enoyl-CoA hydratase /3-hydroxyacyl-CoA dehydrogenase [Marivita hallyeonensis]